MIFQGRRLQIEYLKIKLKDKYFVKKVIFFSIENKWLRKINQSNHSESQSTVNVVLYFENYF